MPGVENGDMIHVKPFRTNTEISFKAKADSVRLKLGEVEKVLYDGRVSDAMRRKILGEFDKLKVELDALMGDCLSERDIRSAEHMLGLGISTISESDLFAIYSVQSRNLPGGEDADEGEVQYILLQNGYPRMVSADDIDDFLEAQLVIEAVKTEYGQEILESMEQDPK